MTMEEIFEDTGADLASNPELFETLKKNEKVSYEDGLFAYKVCNYAFIP